MTIKEDYNFLKDSIEVIVREFNDLTEYEKSIATLDFNPKTLDMGIDLSKRDEEK